MKREFSTVLILLFVTLLGSALLTSCNTLRGVGRDIEQTGDRIGEATR